MSSSASSSLKSLKLYKSWLFPNGSFDSQIFPLTDFYENILCDKIIKRGAPVHANKVLASLKQAFSYGVRRGAMAENPALLLQSRDIGGIEKPRARYLTIHEIKELL